ncbi:hypothetical protein Tco_0999153, partial [Tanacetum coccineum]
LLADDVKGAFLQLKNASVRYPRKWLWFRWNAWCLLRLEYRHANEWNNSPSEHKYGGYKGPRLTQFQVFVLLHQDARIFRNYIRFRWILPENMAKNLWLLQPSSCQSMESVVSNKEVVHNTATIDDKSLQSTLKRIGVNEDNRFWNWNNVRTVVLQKNRLKIKIIAMAPGGHPCSTENCIP